MIQQVLDVVELPMTISSVAGLSPQMTRERSVTDVLGWARELFEPAARRLVDRLGPRSRPAAGYQLGWWDASGAPTRGDGSQALRPALVLLCARAIGGTAEDAVSAAVGAEFVHAFSLMHDDVMDRDPMRGGCPAAWTLFGTPAALAAADELMSLAFEGFFRPGEDVDTACAAAAALGQAVARVARSQALDLAFEHTYAVTIEQCLSMEADKSASLLAAAARLGALYGGSAGVAADRLTAFGEHLGRASALAEHAGDAHWARQSANWHLRSALAQLRKQWAYTDDAAARTALAELAALARFVVSRAWRGPDL
jgi:geranylgeranyl diphosphate synthase, type I